MADLQGGRQGLPDHLQRFLAGHAGGDEGHPAAALGRHRDRIPGRQHGVHIGDHADQAEYLDQGDRDEHHLVSGQEMPGKHVVGIGADRPVRGQQQPPHHGELHDERGRHEQHRLHPVRLAGQHRAVPDAVRHTRFRFGQRPGKLAEALVVIENDLRLLRRRAHRSDDLTPRTTKTGTVPPDGSRRPFAQSRGQSRPMNR